MSALKLLTDGYDRKARLYPALVCMAPMVITGMVVLGAKETALKSLAAGIVGCGGAFLLSQLARDEGKKGERKLYEEWGGMPSVAIFRHQDKRLDGITKARYHKKLATLVKAAAPSRADEENDPAVANETYLAWSNYLRVNTRDTKKYPLVFQELVEYGYRRNLWGLRPAGIIISGLAAMIASGWCYGRHQITGEWSPDIAGAAGLALVFLFLWAFRFTPEWVRIPADAYAERLAETTDTLGAKKPPAAEAAKK